MRIFLALSGIALVLLGGVWLAQAFNFAQKGLMKGLRGLLFGDSAVLAFGVALLVIANSRMWT